MTRTVVPSLCLPDLESYIDQDYEDDSDYMELFDLEAIQEPILEALPEIPAIKDKAPFYSDTLDERINHLSDSFSEYLLYLIKEKGFTNADVYKRAIVDKKVFSNIKNYHFMK